jgi:hypothetical protein
MHRRLRAAIRCSRGIAGKPDSYSTAKAASASGPLFFCLWSRTRTRTTMPLSRRIQRRRRASTRTSRSFGIAGSSVRPNVSWRIRLPATMSAARSSSYERAWRRGHSFTHVLSITAGRPALLPLFTATTRKLTRNSLRSVRRTSPTRVPGSNSKSLPSMSAFPAASRRFSRPKMPCSGSLGEALRCITMIAIDPGSAAAMQPDSSNSRPSWIGAEVEGSIATANTTTIKARMATAAIAHPARFVLVCSGGIVHLGISRL